MNSWKIILATMVIFGTGVLTGGLLVGHYRPEPIAARPVAPGTGAHTNTGEEVKIAPPGG